MLIKIKNSGLGLLEVLLVITLVAFLTSQLLRSLATKKELSLKKSLDEINGIVQKALVQSILEQKIVQLRFHFDELSQLKTINYGVLKNQDELNGDIENTSTIALANKPFVRSLNINNKNEIDSRTRQTWIIIYPQGYCQPCNIVLANQDDSDRQSYEMNPLLCVFEI